MANKTVISFWPSPEFFEKYNDGKHHNQVIQVSEEEGLRVFMNGEEIPTTVRSRLSGEKVNE